MEKTETQSDQLSAGWERVSEELSDSQKNKNKGKNCRRRRKKKPDFTEIKSSKEVKRKKMSRKKAEE
ncbi:unnamed protein product [Enterobius vermicularis]|uniref:BZIP domain-containing protein n=1 Tax=Enterobius vermicularis TaxID=51028 RepID=A0A0N4VPG2_ENTVE|nr:unnamed protein product [Enterobius vermicularis]